MKHNPIVFILIFVHILPALAGSEKRTPGSLKAMGAPNAPQVEIAWNRYYSYDEVIEIANRLQKAFPQLVAVTSIGKSVQGRELILLTVTNHQTGRAESKPAMYIDGNIHSNEIQGTEVSLYTAWYLAESFGTVEWITDLLNRKAFYIVPSINPDARDYFIHQPNSPHSPRSGLLPRDDDGDGLVDEDGYDDLNGDGEIVQMRRLDKRGRWVADSKIANLMIRVEADQKGKYELLGWEGIDNDKDGRLNEDGPGYYDPNRNWGWNWQPDYVQHGADQYPFSIPENQAVAEFVTSHINIAGAQSYHNAGGMILRGPGAEEDEDLYKREDIEIYDFIAERGEEMLPGYRYMVVSKDMYTVYGGELDWFYGARGILTFTNELWTSVDMFGQQDDDAGWFGRRKDTHRFDRLLLFGEGTVDWQPVEHPQYGEIEIGGFRKSWTRTAPSFLLEELCHRNMAFTLYHADQMPLLSIDTVSVTGLEGGVYQVDVVIGNQRLIPTRTQQDIENGITPPDVVAIDAEGVDVIAGFFVKEPLYDEVAEQLYHPDSIRIETIPGNGKAQVRWLLAGSGEVRITCRSQKGGVISETYQF